MCAEAFGRVRQEEVDGATTTRQGSERKQQRKKQAIKPTAKRKGKREKRKAKETPQGDNREAVFFFKTKNFFVFVLKRTRSRRREGVGMRVFALRVFLPALARGRAAPSFC